MSRVIFFVGILTASMGCSAASQRGNANTGGANTGGTNVGAAHSGGATGSASTTSALGGNTRTTTEVSIEELDDGSYRCTPPGAGPFAGVLYNHGGMGSMIGGDMSGTCAALAAAGYVGFAKRRRETMPLEGHLDDVLAGLDTLRESPRVDPERLGIMGFSRGALLALQTSLERPDQLDACIIMAPAPGAGQLKDTLTDVSAFAAKALLLVAENDIAAPANHVQTATDVHTALKQAGKDSLLVVLPPFPGNGHNLFFEIRNEYWPNVLELFAQTL